MAKHPYHEPRLIGSLLREPAQAFQREMVAALAEAYPDLRFAHMGILMHIDHPPEATRLTERAERMQITKQSLGELVDYLEPRGYVERVPDPADRRGKLLRLTERGWQVHEQTTVIGQRIQDAWAERFGAGNMALLLRLLGELGQCLDGGTEAP